MQNAFLMSIYQLKCYAKPGVRKMEWCSLLNLN